MNTAQDILNSLHDQFGLTDSELGEALAVSREHISRLRHGKKNASDGLYSDIRDLLSEISGVHTANQNLEYAQSDNSEISKGSFPWALVIMGLLIVGIIIAIVVATRSTNKENEQESDQPVE